MTCDLVIPTLHRRTKLLNCLSSIEQSKKKDNITVYIYFSDKYELQSFSFKRDWVVARFVYNYKTSVFWNNHLKEMKSDVLIYLNDDVLLLPDTLEIIEKKFIEYFPDYDGIMGLNQTNIYANQKLDSAFGVIGSKFADRFPNREVWCPQYWRFYGDKELGEFAKNINKFKYCEEAKIIHLHPAFDYKQIDNTHLLVREYLNKDKETYENRKKRGFLWGRDYNRC